MARSREEHIGECVLENQEKHRQFVEANRPKWIEQGRGYRAAREALGVTRREMRELTGASETTIAAFESGQPIQRRPLLESSYLTALRFIELQRSPILEAIALGILPVVGTDEFDGFRNQITSLRRRGQE